MKKRVALFLLISLAAAFAEAPVLPEPAAYGVLQYWDAGSGKLADLPWEKVRIPERKTASAEIRGAKSSLRFQEGKVPTIVVAYARAYEAQGSPARLYRLESEAERRVAPLGVWSYSAKGQQTAGAVPLKLEAYGKFSHRVVLPELKPGEYAISNKVGNAAFTFGVDAK